MAVALGRGLLVISGVTGLVALLLGFVAGASISQPLLTAPPARELLAQTDRLDHALLSGLQDPRNISDEARKLRGKLLMLPSKQRSELTADLDQILTRLGDQTVSFQERLWKAHEEVSAVRARLKLQGEANTGRLASAYDQLRRFLKWTGPVLAFSLLLLTPLCLVAFLSPRVRSWLANVTAVGVGPFNLEVADLSKLKQGIRERYLEVDAAIAASYEDVLTRLDIQRLFARLKVEIDKELKRAFGVDLAALSHRATLYVPGFVGEELVQVTEYIPDPQDGRKVVGRRFSVRYGIIGRTFRLRTAMYDWDVNNQENALIRQWGLTRSEAYKQGTHASSLMAFPIPPDQSGDPVGIIYLEVAGVNQLMPSETISDLQRRVPDDPDGRVQADKLANDKLWMPIWDSKRAQPVFEALLAMKTRFNWDTPLRTQDGK